MNENIEMTRRDRVSIVHIRGSVRSRGKKLQESRVRWRGRCRLRWNDKIREKLKEREREREWCKEKVLDKVRWRSRSKDGNADPNQTEENEKSFFTC